MIYTGFLHFEGCFNSYDNVVHVLQSVLSSYTQKSPTVIKMPYLTICYGKLSDEQDMDEVFDNRSSFLIGRVFNKDLESDFLNKDFKNLSSLSKEKVLEKIWGKYVYIKESNKTSQFTSCSAPQFEIVIDSTGQLPFFYYPFSDGRILFSSDIEIIFKILSQNPFSQKHEINWTYLCSYIVYGNSSAIQTPFKNLYEVPPGCCLKITKNERNIEPFWNPLGSYKTTASQQGNPVEILQRNLKHWVKPYKNICVHLSGGLDSSSLLYCLNNIKNEEQVLTAFNYFHSAVKSSNELVHARKVCKETGVELFEIDSSSVLPFDPSYKKQLLKPNKPFPGLVDLKGLEYIANYIPSNGSTTFIGGHGSDNIFMCPPSKRSISDYILEKGFKGSSKKLQDITNLYRDPLFSTLKENAKSLGAYVFSWRNGKRHPQNIYTNTPDWIKQELRKQTSPEFVHPIYETLSKKILPGKYDQIDALYEGLASIHMEMNHIYPTFHPFLYEPVVDFALSFHSYELYDKGYDRYPLRKAFNDYFKTETVWRRDKGQTMGLFQLGIKKHLEYVLDLCLEGQFVKQGLIDREELHKTILLISNGNMNHLWPLLYLASVEIFLKCWEE